MCEGKFVEKNQNTSYSVAFFFFSENLAVMSNVEKYSTTDQATDDNMAHAHCMLDT